MNFSYGSLFPVVFRQMFYHSSRRRTGIVDHDVHAAEVLRAVLDEFLNLVVVGQVAGQRHDFHARGI